MGELPSAARHPLQAPRLAPPGALSLLTGERPIRRLYPLLFARALRAGEGLLVADGGNSFDAYAFSELAGWLRLKRERLLRQVKVSRAFTCHQLLALVRALPGLCRKEGIRLVALPGLLDTFYDENIPSWEARGVLEATGGALRQAASEGLALLAVCPGHEMEGRRPLLRKLAAYAERIAILRGMDGRGLEIELFRPGRRLIHYPLPPGAAAFLRAEGESRG